MKTTPKSNCQPRRRLSVLPRFIALPIKGDSRKSVLAAIALATTLSPFASAASFAFNLNFKFSGSTPAETAPWITATFDDTTSGIPGDIRLTVAANNLSGTEKVGGFYFNLDPLLDAANLTFSIVSPNPTGLTNTEIERGNNAHKADGDGYYDVFLNFPNDNTLTAGETLTLDISRVGGLTLENFIYGSSPTGPNGNGSSPNGTFYAAAHVQSIGTGSTSGWIGQRDTTTVTIIPTNPIPEPSSVTLAGLAMVAVCLRRKR